MLAALALLATVHATWPRLETGETWYRAVHVPKSGGTTHDRALVAVYCFHAGQETCMRQSVWKSNGASPLRHRAGVASMAWSAVKFDFHTGASAT